jgi:DNA-binding NtrC family response regulator
MPMIRLEDGPAGLPRSGGIDGALPVCDAAAAPVAIIVNAHDPRTLLVSQDGSLMEAAREVVSATRGFRLEIVAEIETTCDAILGDDRILVVLVHLDGRTDFAGVTRILQAVAQTGRPVVTIAIHERENREQALALTRLGVAACLSRPLDLGRLSYLIDALTIEARYRLRKSPAPAVGAGEVHGLGDKSPFLFVPDTRMGRMLEQIKRIAPLETTVMLGGETGTGKTHLARVIHRLSPRRDEPFLTINCGALAANLIESEMFGQVRGAFTGADAGRTGKFAAVGRGTLFLDEIDSLPPQLQAKLLRVVEERAFEPVGSNQTMRLGARLIVASNRPLEREVAAGRFRADLYYRFHVVAFEVPPLRERRPLIPALARSLLAEFASRNGRRIDAIAPNAMQALLAHSWPGNIRELRNVIERAVALCPGDVIGLDDLPEHIHATGPAMAADPTPKSVPGAAPSPSEVPAVIPFASPVGDLRGGEEQPSSGRSLLADSRERTEHLLIAQALERNGWNRLRAAAELGISRMTLYKKLHKYGLMGA